MGSFSEVLDLRLKKLDEAFQRRVLKSRSGIDFSSNDYLGFSQDPVLQERVLRRLRGQPVGASGARLLRGHFELFETVEQNLARFSGQEAALILPSGYQANLALLSGVLTAEDWVFSDQFNHASLIDGIRLSRARRVIYPHRDGAALRRALEESHKQPGLKIIVTESLFGMDGSQAPLAQLVDLAEEYSALLMVDEAHATGLWGDGVLGGGIVQSLGLSERVFATTHTGGKALGTGGAWIAGSAKLIHYLVNFSRPFIFSTAPVPSLVISLDEALQYWSEVGNNRAKALFSKADQMQARLVDLEIPCRDPSPIVPIILGENEMALQVAERIQNCGFDVRAIRPPTVPEGTARLRISVHWDHTIEVIQALSNQVLAAIREVRSTREEKKT